MDRIGSRRQLLTFGHQHRPGFVQAKGGPKLQPSHCSQFTFTDSSSASNLDLHCTRIKEPVISKYCWPWLVNFRGPLKDLFHLDTMEGGAAQLWYVMIYGPHPVNIEKMRQAVAIWLWHLLGRCFAKVCMWFSCSCYICAACPLAEAFPRKAMVQHPKIIFQGERNDNPWDLGDLRLIQYNTYIIYI